MTTPNAGKIRIELDLNADDLSSEITRAVQRELEPVLKKIQAEINKTARDLDKIDGRAFLEVAVDAKAAEREISKQADAATKAAVANEADAATLRDLAKAEAEFAAAQKSGDLIKRTAAMQGLIKAQNEYEKATGKSAGAERDIATAAEGSARRRTAAERSIQSEIARTQAAEQRAARAAEDDARRAERTAQDAQVAAARRAAQAEADAQRRADKLAQIAAEAAKRTEVREAEDARRRAARHEQDVRDATARAARGEMQERQRAERAATQDAARAARRAEQDAAREARAAERGMRAGGGGGGGFGGGGGGGRGGGRGPQRPYHHGISGMVGRSLMSPIGSNVIGLGLAGLPAATAGVVSLANAVNDLAMSGLAVPGILGGIGASAVTAIVGLNGMKEAVKDLIKAQKDDDPKEMQKALDQLKDMDPAAQATAKSISNLVNGPFKDLSKSVQGTMFSGVANDIDRIGVAVGPRLRTDMGKTAAAWNNTIHTMTGQLTSGTNLGFMDRIFGNTADAQNRANRAIAPMSHAIADLTAQSSNALPRIADGVAKVATRFDNFVTKSVNNGNLDKWIDQGLTGMDRLGNSAINFGKALEGIFRAQGSGGFLQWLQNATERFSTFVNSAKGQNQIAEFFKEAREDAALWMPVLGDLMHLFGGLITGAQQWSHILLPFLDNTVGTLTKIPGLVEGVTTAFLAWRSISGISSMLDKLKGVDNTLGGVGGKARTVAAACNTACTCEPGTGGGMGGGGTKGAPEEQRTGRSRMGGILRGGGSLLGALGFGVATDQLMEGLNPDNRSGGGAGGWLQAVGGGAGTGALIGSMIEPGLGTAIGAGIGGVGGALGKLLFGTNPAPAPGGIMPGALAPDEYRKLIQQISQPAGGQANWNQQSVDQAVYGATGSFDPRKYQFDTLKKGTSGYNDMATRLLQSGLPGVDQSNAGKTLDTIISQAQVAKGALDKLNNDIVDLPTGEVVLKDPTPEILQRVKDLGLGLKTLPNGLIALDTTQLNAANTKADDLKQTIDQIISGQGQIGSKFKPNDTQVGGNALDPSFFMPGGKAGGGVLPGWSPGHDNMLVPMGGGEGVLIPRAAQALGGAPGIDAINRVLGHGYAGGGLIGPLPWHPDSDVLGGGTGSDQRNNYMMLSEIRNLLAGTASGPLSMMQFSLQNIATGGVPAGLLPRGTTPGRIGPFGTPIAPHDRGYDAAAGALKALGGDPEYVFGSDPVKYAQQTWDQVQSKLKDIGGVGALGRSANPKDYIGPLSQFAQSGQVTPDMVKMGLGVDNPIIKELMSARGAKGYEQVPGYISQVLGQGAFTGQLTPENQAIISALTQFQQTLAKQAQVDQELEILLQPMGGMKGLQSQLLAMPGGGLSLPSTMPGAMMPGAAGVAGGGSVPIIQRPDGTWTSSDPEWAKLMQRESGGSPTVPNTTDSNAAAGHPSIGLFQITQPTWIANGGLKYARTPGEAKPEDQAAVAANILRANPSGSDWGLDKGGREDPSKLLTALGAAPAPVAPAAPALPPVAPAAGPAMPAPPPPPAAAAGPAATIPTPAGAMAAPPGWHYESIPGHAGGQMVKDGPGAAPPASGPPGSGKAPAGAIWMPAAGGYFYQGQLHKEWAPPLGETPTPGAPLPAPAAPPPAAPSPFALPQPPAPGAPGMPPVPGMPAAPAALTGGGGLNLSTIPVAAQKYANDCIDASARIILSHSGANLDEDQLKGVIAPGGTISSQAAGLNQLNPAGLYQAMEGSGGSAQALFAAVKASIDKGIGSILNVAPGSSIAGRPFSEGHFIAATGYNADGTINLSDTAKGTKYSVTADDAFQATRGRGIVVGTGTGPPPTQGPGAALMPGGTAGIGPGGVPITGGGYNGLSSLGGMGTGGIIPVYVVNMGGGGGGAGNMLQNLLGGPISAAGNAAAGVAGDAISAVPGAVASQFESPAGLAAPNAKTSALIQQGNPLAFASALGYNVPDLTRNGQSGITTASFMQPQQQYLANGQMLSNTTGLSQRTDTDLIAQLAAMRDQMVGATKDVSKGLGDKVLTPIMKAGVNTGISTLSNTVLTGMGTQLGNAMAPAIGAAVAKSTPATGSSDASGLAAVPFDAGNAISSAVGLASGGGVSGGTPGVDSVPAMLMPNEYVLNTQDVARLGGVAGVDRFTSALASGKVRHFAAGGGVIGNATVGADFFGVSQVPIIGTIVNMLINILLTMIGAQITVRDTLTTLTDNFRQFRGDTFKAFNSQGQMFNDTSGLAERSESSTQEVTDERVRILTQVLQALIKYIIDKVIVPIAEAVGQALINAGASAAGGALGPFGGGAITGGVSTIGDAAVQIAGQVGQDFGDAASAVIVQELLSGGQQLFPGLFSDVLGGGAVENDLTGPLGSLLGGVVGGFTGLITALMGVVGLGSFGNNTGSLLGFDEGGMANGVGLMPKATISPERVLSPSQTDSFERLVSALEGGNFGGGNSTVIHAPFTVTGGAGGGAAARDRLLELL